MASDPKSHTSRRESVVGVTWWLGMEGMNFAVTTPKLRPLVSLNQAEWDALQTAEARFRMEVRDG